MTTSRFLPLLAGLACVALAALLFQGLGVALAKHRHAAEANGRPGLANATLLVIRHAEKPARDGDPGLSRAGRARAQAYADYFRHLEIDGAPVRIDTLVASADSEASARPRLTLEPLAAATGLTIKTPFSNKQVKDAADWIADGGTYGTTLIAWHHGRLGKLLDRLGADPATLLPGGDWPDDVYDWIIVLRYDGLGGLVDSKRIVEPVDLAKKR